jgi:phosphate transport system permease protein
MNKALYARRRMKNRIFLTLSVGAAAFGIAWLAIILYSLITQGLAGLALKDFTEITPAPGSDGGLSNAIVGSLIMSALAVLIGTPIGVFGGTYLAEYGRHNTTSVVVRFINDILLSAPSIIIGVFVYQLVIVRMGFDFPVVLVKFVRNLTGVDIQARHFSGIAGVAALTVIVIPVVVRTTENMLLLVPNTLREAAAALGTPRNHIIRTVTWKAARAGIMTGVLLAIARISGETAPLLFTALGNSSMSTDLTAPMASLPKVIFDFAQSPYDDWHRLAWAGALIITFAVLTLSIIARIFESQREL